MKHRIDPTVDYVFKALLGAEDNTDLLIHFLNGFLPLPSPIREVQIINPFVPAEFDGDDYTVVDVQARDADGNRFAVEIQNQVRPRLASRMVYGLCDLYQSQLASGGDFAALRPVHAIWVLDQNLLKESPAWLHHFQLRDLATGTRISDHLGLHTVELRKWRKPAAPLAPADQWVYLLREGRNWDDLPADLQSPEMRKAMAILDQISEKTRDYLRYQARQNFLREQRTMERLMEEERQGRREAIEQLEQERVAKEQERAAKEAALTAEHAARAEAEALRARLRALGIDPDAP